MTHTIWGKISRNALSNLVGTVVFLAVGFFLMPFIIHRIGSMDFGIWVLVTSLVGYMGLLDIGLAPTLVKMSSEFIAKGDKSNLNQKVSTIFTLYLLAGTLVCAAALALSLIVPGAFNVPQENIKVFKTVLWIAGLQIALSFPMSIWSGLIGGLQDFHVINGIGIITNLVKAAGTVFLLISGFGLISLVWLGFGVSFIGWLAGMLWVKQRIPYLRIKLSRLEWTNVKDLGRFSGIMFVWTIASITLIQADRIIIGLFLPIASVTTYEVGARISNYSRVLSNSILPAIMPAASELNAINDKAKLRQMYLQGTRYILITYTVVVSALLVFGKDFIRLWMGDGFEESVWVMYALLVGFLYQSQNVVAHVMLPGIDKLKVFFRAMTAYPVVDVILCITFVSQTGLIGVALATALTLITVETYLLFHIIKIFEIRLISLLVTCHLPATLSITPGMLIIYYLPIIEGNSWPELVLGIISFLTLCFISFWLMGISRDERHQLRCRALTLLRGASI